jgi:hypothetical protein
MGVGTDEHNKAATAGDTKDAEYGRSPELDSDHDANSLDSETQAGVKKVEAISKVWTTGGLVVAYST